MIFRIAVNVMPKQQISDPQGQTVQRALPSIGFPQIDDVRIGKRITLAVAAPDAGSAIALVAKACEKFLANPIIEDFEIEVTS